MNKEDIKIKIFDGYPFVPIRESIGSDKCVPPSDGEITCIQYVDRLLDILEETENHGLEIDDNSLINYLKLCEGGNGTSQKAAEEDMKRRLQLKDTLKSNTFKPIKEIANWEAKSVFWQRLEFWFVGIIGTVVIGFLSFLLPYINDLRSSNEPITVIIEQTSSANPVSNYKVNLGQSQADEEDICDCIITETNP